MTPRFAFMALFVMLVMPIAPAHETSTQELILAPANWPESAYEAFQHQFPPFPVTGFAANTTCSGEAAAIHPDGRTTAHIHPAGIGNLFPGSDPPVLVVCRWNPTASMGGEFVVLDQENLAGSAITGSISASAHWNATGEWLLWHYHSNAFHDPQAGVAQWNGSEITSIGKFSGYPERPHPQWDFNAEFVVLPGDGDLNDEMEIRRLNHTDLTLEIMPLPTPKDYFDPSPSGFDYHPSQRLFAHLEHMTAANQTANLTIYSYGADALYTEVTNISWDPWEGPIRNFDTDARAITDGALDWSPNGAFIASENHGKNWTVWKYDAASETLTELYRDTRPWQSVGAGTWDHSSSYYAVIFTEDAGAPPEITPERVIFQVTASSVTQVDSKEIGIRYGKHIEWGGDVFVTGAMAPTGCLPLFPDNCQELADSLELDLDALHLLLGVFVSSVFMGLAWHFMRSPVAVGAIGIAGTVVSTAIGAYPLWFAALILIGILAVLVLRGRG